MEKAEFEWQLKATNSMADLRELSNRSSGFQSAFTKSLESCIDLINDRFRQLIWTGSPIRIFPAAAAVEMEEIENIFKNLDESAFVDGIRKTDKNKMMSSTKLQEFMSQHVRCSSYSFQIKKIKGCRCHFCETGLVKPVRMDAKQFDEISWLPLP